MTEVLIQSTTREIRIEMDPHSQEILEEKEEVLEGLEPNNNKEIEPKDSSISSGYQSTQRKSRKEQKLKQLTSGRKKSRRKREMFLDGQGNSIIEKSELKGKIDLVGEKKELNLSEKILPPSAKIVLSRNQYRRKNQRTEDEFENEEDLEEEEMKDSIKKPSNYSLGDFISGSSSEESEDDLDFLKSPFLTIEASKNTLELLKSLPKDDSLYQEQLEKALIIKSTIEEFISRPSNEENILCGLLEQFELLSSLF